MEITKIGHCCLLIKTAGLTILTDPGAFSTAQNSITGIDVVLITHEHGDHIHAESVKEIVKNNPMVKIFTNSGVSKILKEQGIDFELLEGRATKEISGVLIEAFDCKHEEIYKEFGQVQNTAYFIANKLFYPGDAFFNPKREVEILALPVVAPWCRIREVIAYALEVKPKKAFPVHDAILAPNIVSLFHRVPGQVLGENGIEFIPLKAGEKHDF